MKRLVRPASAAVVAGLVLAGCLPPKAFDEIAWRQQVDGAAVAGLYAEHRDPKGRFFNPWLPQERPWTEFWRWRLSRSDLGPEVLDLPTPVVPNDGSYLADPAAPASLTQVGHATFVVQWDGQVVLTDPFFSSRAAIVPRLVPPAFPAEPIPAGAVVLISHNHYDHLDADSVAALGDRTVFLCPPGLGDLLRDYGAREVREVDWWEEVDLGGTRFTALPAQHWSRRLWQGRNRTLWCSWLLRRGERSVYYGADSGYFIGYREFGRRYPGIDVALLPIGAFAPRWFMHYAHMDIPEVLRAFEDLGARTLVPIQWGVLKLGDEPAAWPIEVLHAALVDRPELSDRVEVLPIGGRMLLGGGR